MSDQSPSFVSLRASQVSRIVPFAVIHGVPTAVYEIIHLMLLDYIPFIVLLLALFTVPMIGILAILVWRIHSERDAWGAGPTPGRPLGGPPSSRSGDPLGASFKMWWLALLVRP